MKVNEVSKVSGVSVRTLHHYDEIGLLKPEKSAGSGYRNYSDQDLSTLQQILFFRELDFPLKKIKEIINRPDYDQLEALEMHRELLRKKREKLDAMLETINETIEKEKGGVTMSNDEKFKGFDFSHNPYEHEARKRWGDEAVDEARKNAMKMSKEHQEEMNEIYRKLAAIRHENPKSEQAQAAIRKWYDYLNAHFTTYSPDAFQGLGMMYVQDERFTKNIDQFGDGLAVFMSEAMYEYGEQLKK
ncbi:MerR family transcriptional regulator [Halalkalibacillus sediminis]|uniref:MerR family transcriptional regulator n=1 Tax=Halalkalibacillus sediminis TaxID=2018042 RepID=A0A2I0QRC4_9BACI|nr:MerR family transcriptional regulator [Halalkalibacillus sediminis]PKR76869.1 MerR family transcriptional regulator [Halalkalibacillus sediminis]